MFTFDINSKTNTEEFVTGLEKASHYVASGIIIKDAISAAFNPQIKQTAKELKAPSLALKSVIAGAFAGATAAHRNSGTHREKLVTATASYVQLMHVANRDATPLTRAAMYFGYMSALALTEKLKK